MLYYVSTQKVSFNCPTATLETIDRMAEADHRDRSSMLLKIISEYLSQQPKKKAGTR
jgi:metal-responsive CopG/Arc/MetJ family transcriptional regulator